MPNAVGILWNLLHTFELFMSLDVLLINRLLVLKQLEAVVLSINSSDSILVPTNDSVIHLLHLCSIML